MPTRRREVVILDENEQSIDNKIYEFYRKGKEKGVTESGQEDGKKTGESNEDRWIKKMEV